MMPLPARAPPSLADLPCRNGAGAYLVVVEARAGSRNKYKFEPSLGALALHKVLPLGTSFPYCFGFVPSTRAEDGDPIDVVVFMDEPAEPGTIVPCRLAGIIEATQTEKGKTVRNDRLVGVAVESTQHARVRDIGDIAKPVLDELGRFFAFYNEQEGKVFTPKRIRGKAAAQRAVEKARRSREREVRGGE